MLLSPNLQLFKLFSEDMQITSPWHAPSTHPSSWYLKRALEWHSLGPHMNLSVRLTKGQAFSPSFLYMPLEHVCVVHFMGCSKPLQWLNHGTIEPFRKRWWTQVKLPANFNDATWALLSNRGQEALRTYVVFACQAIVKSALATGWKIPEGPGTKPALRSSLRSAILHVIVQTRPKSQRGINVGEAPCAPLLFFRFKLYNIVKVLFQMLYRRTAATIHNCRALFQSNE